MSPVERRCLAALTLSFVLLGLAFSVVVPLFANYDEQTHVDRVGYTARHPFDEVGPELRRTFGSVAAMEATGSPDTQGPALWRRAPVDRPDYLPFGDYPGGNHPQHQGCPGSCQNFQFAHPPAWYVLMAPVYSLLDDHPFPRTVLVLRILDVLLVAPLVALTWWAARQLWPGTRRRALAAAALVATAGPLAFTASGANNDGLMLLSAGVAVAVTVAISRRGANLARSAVLGIAMGIGLLTKIELAVIAPVVGLVVICAPKVSLARWKAALLVAVPALPGVIWWVAHQISGGVLNPEGSEVATTAVAGPWAHTGVLAYAFHRVPMLLDRFWGLYGVPAFVAPRLWRTLLWLALEALVVLWLLCRDWRRPTRDDGRLALLALMPVALTAAVIWASLKTYRVTGEVRALAPRYLYAVLPILALAVVAAAGMTLRRIAPPAWSRWALRFGIPVVGAVAGLGSFVHAVQGLYGTSDLSLLLDRAHVVAPVAHPGPWVVALLVGWALAIAAAAVTASRVDRPPRARRSPEGPRADLPADGGALEAVGAPAHLARS